MCFRSLVGMTMLAIPLLASAADRLVEGKPDSEVRVLIYEDLQCSDCAVFRKMLDEKLLPRYAGTVAFEHRDFPLAKHAWARKAAIASRHFARTDRDLAIAWRRYALEHLADMTENSFNARLGEFAREHGADPDHAVSALDDPNLTALVQQDFDEGVARGIARTPTALVNGQPFIETFSAEEISKAIDSELAALKAK